MVLALTFLTACQDNEQITKPAPIDLVESESNQNVSVRAVDSINEAPIPIRDGSGTEAGYIFLANDNQYLYVSYYLEDGWHMTHNYLHVASSYAEIPQNNYGAPLPEQFNNNTTLTRGVSVLSVKIPFAELNAGIGDDIVIASLVTLARISDVGKVDGSESVWVGDLAGRGPEWWSFAQYKLRQKLNNPGGKDLSAAVENNIQSMNQ